MVENTSNAITKTMQSLSSAALKTLNLSVTHGDLGAATMQQRVDESMINIQGLCHGGMIFALADTACAFACATLCDGVVTTESNISFIKAAKLGDVLTAAATVDHDGKKLSHASVIVKNQHDETIAIFKGTFLKWQSK